MSTFVLNPYETLELQRERKEYDSYRRMEVAEKQCRELPPVRGRTSSRVLRRRVRWTSTTTTSCVYPWPYLRSQGESAALA